MTNIVLLNNVDHADLRVVRGHAAAFGDSVNLVRAFPTEFEALQRSYPILFQPDAAEGLVPIALLGLDRDENLFLDGGRWDAPYVPAAQRRGPFSIGIARGDGAPGGGNPMINVDLDHPRVVAEGGEPVFKPHGGNTPYLDDVAMALATIYEGIEATAPMLRAFTEHDLLEPVEIDLTAGEGQRYTLADFHSIRRDRLDALDGAALEALHRGGHLSLAIYAAASLGNLDALVARKNARSPR